MPDRYAIVVGTKAIEKFATLAIAVVYAHTHLDNSQPWGIWNLQLQCWVPKCLRDN